MICFNRYSVYNTETRERAQVRYSASEHYGKPGQMRPAVVLYATDYSGRLGKVFTNEYRNDSDSREDYFERGKVVLRPEHPLYAEALAQAALQTAA